MDFKTMETAALEARKQEIAGEATEDRSLEELTSLEAEMRAISEELETRKAAEEERKALAAAISNNTTIEPTNMVEPETRKEETKMEVRNTREYIDAFAEYMKTGRPDECRALLSENASGGTVAVPEFVYDIIKNAWQDDEVTSRVRKTYLKGNLKVNFEISSTGATDHAEGSGAVSEEELVLGTVTIIASNLKKWVGVSDEVMDMRGEAFLRYIYDELSHKIVEGAVDKLLALIANAPAASTATAVAVSSITATTPAITDFVTALGNLNPRARQNVIITDRVNWAAYEALRASAGYAYDPFLGMPVVYATMPAGVRAIVGDLDLGVIFNYPNGEDVKLTFDEYTQAPSDMNRVIGRMFVGIGLVAPNAFCVIKSA